MEDWVMIIFISHWKTVHFKECYKCGRSIYLFIDEYDHFTNQILSEPDCLDDYKSETHGTGYLRSFFDTVKSGTDSSIKRCFVTGVSPVTMDDLTSGFNIGTNYNHITDEEKNLLLTQDCADIFEARGIENYEELIGIKDLRNKEKLSGKALRKASEILDDSNVCEYLADFQKEYLEEKPRYMANYSQAKKTYTKLKKILPLLRGEFTEGYDILDDILDFFGVDSETEIFEASEKQAALFRTQNKIEVDSINLHAWLRRGELDFNALNLPDYDENGVMAWIESREWMNHIEEIDFFKSLPSVFSRFGVGLVFVPSLPKTVYGAIRWIEGKPLIQISDRGQDLISCWFTLFHEVGHAIKHKNVEIYEGEINESKAKQNKREKVANKFANEYLFNGDNLRKAVFDRKRGGQCMSAKSLAEEFNVKPIFASYWLRKAQYEPAFQSRIHIDFTSQYQ